MANEEFGDLSAFRDMVATSREARERALREEQQAAHKRYQARERARYRKERRKDLLAAGGLALGLGVQIGGLVMLIIGFSNLIGWLEGRFDVPRNVTVPLAVGLGITMMVRSTVRKSDK